MKKLLALIVFAVVAFTGYAQEKKVMVMEIKNEIDPRMKRYVELALEHAEETKADIVIVEMDTYGGVLTDAKEIVDLIMDFKKPVWVYINSDAASAGALISIACDSIYMSAGASIGAATVVDGSGEKAPDKYQSYMRSIMRSTAEENGRDPRIAEGLVDESFKIDSIKKEGQVITFSTSEAIKYNYCEAKVESIEEILKRNNVSPFKLDRFELSAVDSIVVFFLNPFISGLLILAIIAGIYFEMQTPGMGFAGLIALIALILYLIPYSLHGLAANWEIIALLVGIALIALEIFVIPGFGVTGIAGIALTVMSLILIMINNDAFDFELVRMNDILLAVAATFGGMIGGFALLIFGGARLTRTKAFNRVTLNETQNSKEGFTTSRFKESMKGKKGIAHTVLRPSGRVVIDDEVLDAYTRGEYIEKGASIEVVSQEGSTLQVRQIN
jgi:membrane-bound serine protease (ClpP class)